MGFGRKKRGNNKNKVIDSHNQYYEYGLTTI